MNLVRRAQILNIILAHMTNAADEIERVLFERDPDWRKHTPSPSPTNAPAGFAQAAAEDHLRALAEQGHDPDQAARDYLAQPDERPVIDDAFERALQTHRERHAKSQDVSSAQEQPKPQEPPRPNPDNVWGAVHKLRERFGEEAAQVLIEALSGRMDAQAAAEREPLEQRVLKIHRAAFDAINDDNAKPAPGSFVAIPKIQELEEKAKRLELRRVMAERQRDLTREIVNAAKEIVVFNRVANENLCEAIAALSALNIDFDKLTPKSTQDPTR